MFVVIRLSHYCDNAAKIGSTSLVNAQTDNCKEFSKSIFLVGTIKATTCPSGTSDTLSVTIPVPNVSGQVSGVSDKIEFNASCDDDLTIGLARI